MENGQGLENDTTVNSRPMNRRHRAAQACTFCRQRKIKCGNEQSQCSNCKLYGRECDYNELPKKSRPSRARIADLEEENRLLQAQLLYGDRPSEASSSSCSTTEPSQNLCHEHSVQTVGSRPSTVTTSQEDSIAGGPQQALITSCTGAILGNQSNYYGRTSALFDEERADRRGPRVLSNAGTSSERTRRELMGEAAHQRQLENINYNSGMLDFDGVDPELGMHLLSLHWNRQHHSHLITYRPAFMRDMACQGPYFSKLLLNAIYFGASKFSPRPELRRDLKAAGQPFRQRVRDLLGGALDRSEITTIQALLVMTNSLFALGDERSAAWLYAGTAFRMIIDLGMHDDQSLVSNHRLTEEDFEIRRRVFWGAFVVDKIQSLYQGRPVSLQEADIRVPMRFQDHYEELEHWTPFAYAGTQGYPGSPAYSVSTFTELCKLSVIMNAILNKVYGVKSAKRGPERLAEDLKAMQADLDLWQSALPSHLNFDPMSISSPVPPPHVLSLHAMFNVLIILLHRPFVSEGHLHSISPSIPVNSFVVCALAATKIVQLLRVYHQTFSVRHAPYLISYATYVSATIHVRIAAQTGPGSDAHKSLRTCLSVFNENQETNLAARRAQTVIVNLMKKMKIELSNNLEFLPGTDDQLQGDSSITGQNESTLSIGMPLTSANDLGNNNVPSTYANGDYQKRMVPDLDMNAIIHSFIQGQNTNWGSNIEPARPYPEFRVGFGPNNLAQNIQSPGFGTEFGGTAWNTLDFPADGSMTVDDMLFGFHGAASDGLW